MSKPLQTSLFKLPSKPQAAKKPDPNRVPREEPVGAISVVEMPPHLNENVVQRINNLRRKMLIHSYLYYRMGTSVVSDESWDKWAKELKKLQAEFPEESKYVPYYEDFKDWDATTGYHLPLGDPWVEKRALWLLDTHKKEEEKKNGTKKGTS